MQCVSEDGSVLRQSGEMERKMVVKYVRAGYLQDFHCFLYENLMENIL